MAQGSIGGGVQHTQVQVQKQILATVDLSSTTKNHFNNANNANDTTSISSFMLPKISLPHSADSTGSTAVVVVAQPPTSLIVDLKAAHQQLNVSCRLTPQTPDYHSHNNGLSLLKSNGPLSSKNNNTTNKEDAAGGGLIEIEQNPSPPRASEHQIMGVLRTATNQSSHYGLESNKIIQRQLQNNN